MSDSHPTRQLHNVKVIKHLPLGLLIELENHQHGIVRVREIAWDEHQREQWRSLYPPGWTGQALPISNLQKGHPEYSLRLAEDDPWDELAAIRDKQQIFQGTVTGVVTFGAFIEIASGLTGLLHKSQLPAWVGTLPIDLFWPGDRVRVTLREINLHERRLNLGLPPTSLAPVAGQLPETPARSPLGSGENGSSLDEFLNSGTRNQRILLVEDEPDQQAAVSNWLTRIGQHVDPASNAMEALRYLSTSRPDLAIIDVGLPDVSGTDLAATILERWPQVRVIIATDWARQEAMADLLDALRARGVEMYPKPLLPEDLLAMLREKNAPAEALPAASTDLPHPGLSLDDLPGLQAGRSLQDLLHQCRRHLGFDQALLFEFDPIHRATSLLERSGEGQLNKAALPGLVYSPVRDVAEDGKMIVMSEIGAHEKDRFRYLLELIPDMESCIGVPVRAETQSAYALFLPGKHVRQITKEQRLYAEALAQVIGSLLEQKQFKEKSVLIQRTTLIGHLTRAMVHEINNLVVPLASRLDTLQTTLARLEKNPNQAEIQERKNLLLSAALNETREIIRRIINTTRMFWRIVEKGKKPEILRVDEIIDETIHLLRDNAARAHVHMVFNRPEQMLIIRNQAVAFEQVLLNVVLNAIQQVNEFRPETGGWVQVRVDTSLDPAKTGLHRLLIEDNGPGIHARLWNKIFEAGYTTRHDGSGIGLYISRNLVEEMGGRIYVKESCVLGGTTFALEIPAQL
jgi:signal transduction histidine kinase/ActR/RegA family two-component response regulator/predicted RNA-binding protein with RPS1 domain